MLPLFMGEVPEGGWGRRVVPRKFACAPSVRFAGTSPINGGGNKCRIPFKTTLNPSHDRSIAMESYHSHPVS